MYHRFIREEQLTQLQQKLGIGLLYSDDYSFVIMGCAMFTLIQAYGYGLLLNLTPLLSLSSL